MGKKKFLQRGVSKAVAHVKATWNNTLVTITDPLGNAIVVYSAGRAGFSGSKKSTVFAATSTAQEAAKLAKARGVERITCRAYGPGPGKEAALKALMLSFPLSPSDTTSLKDTSSAPHNGCKPRKKRRI